MTDTPATERSLSRASSVATGLFVGLMSGTSLDGVDAVLVAFGQEGHAFQLFGHHYQPFTAQLRATLLALNSPGSDELHRAALASNALARVYATATSALLTACGKERDAVTALGAHGQTVRHRPGEFDGLGYTLQLLNGALLAELTGIDVICDFRSRDVAAGGQGAPLVPAFHRALFDGTGQTRAVLNIGGIANLTVLPAPGEAAGFDCGPGNVLMDLWCERHLGQPFDRDGRWAAQGRVIPALLAALLDDEFIRRTPPKSTGRDHYNAGWLDDMLSRTDGAAPPSSPQDVQATLAEFTAQSAAVALKTVSPDVRELLVCGGGALNGNLMRLLSRALPMCHVRSTSAANVDPMHVEASAFAWLAYALLAGQPGNIPAVTGAKGFRPLGAWHSASCTP